MRSLFYFESFGEKGERFRGEINFVTRFYAEPFRGEHRKKPTEIFNTEETAKNFRDAKVVVFLAFHFTRKTKELTIKQDPIVM